MRKGNTNREVPLDAVPERRTERCSPRFQSGGRFCELSFRYQLSPTGFSRRGREMPVPRPYLTDPFHSLSSILIQQQFLYIRSYVLIISSNWYLKGCLEVFRLDNCACALAETLISRFRAIIKVFFLLYCMWMRWYLHACAFSEQMKWAIISQPMSFLTIFFFGFFLSFCLSPKQRFLFAILSSLLLSVCPQNKDFYLQF